MKTRTRLAALLLAGLALSVGPPRVSAQPGGGIEIPEPDLDVFVAANGGVRVSNVGDVGAKVPAFKLRLTCKNVKSTRGGSNPPPPCGMPFASGPFEKTIGNLNPGTPNPSDPCGQAAPMQTTHYPGSLVLCLPIATWEGGDYTITAKVNTPSAFYEKSTANNTATTVVHVASKRPTAPLIQKPPVTPRTEKKRERS